MNSQNIFQSIPDDIEKEIFETLVQSDDVKIERIISKGHQSPESGWYDETRNEWVLVLKGEAIIEYESGEQEKLGEGSFINIPAHTKHRYRGQSQIRKRYGLQFFINSSRYVLLAQRS